MIKELEIYTNFKNYNFFTQIFTEYSLSINSINEMQKNLKNQNNKTIILYVRSNEDKLNMKFVSANCLLITNEKNLTHYNHKNTLLINKPITPIQLKNTVNKYLHDFEIFFEDISIKDKTMQNILLNKSVFLTEIENNILKHLIENKVSNKEHIKKYILNINKNVETNSIESHLTRIRKKFQKIQTQLIIQSRNDKVSIFNFQKKED